MSRPHLLHFSYHKCLTVFYGGVMRRTMAPISRDGGTSGYKHLNSRKDEFAAAVAQYRAVSLNNHSVALDEIGEFRASRFVRDPRDLLVSGYFYHKRGAEAWSRLADPTPSDWAVVNGTIPKAMPAGTSYADYLSSLDLEAGLLAELEWREAHFASMLDWPDDDERILVLRYEDILGKEQQTVATLFDHYGIRGPRRALALFWAQRLSLESQAGKTAHIRNAKPSQWRDTVPQSVVDELARRHPGLLEKYHYA